MKFLLKLYLFLALFILSCGESYVFDASDEEDEYVSEYSTMEGSIRFDEEASGVCKIINYETGKSAEVEDDSKAYEINKFVYYIDKNMFAKMQKHHPYLKSLKEIIPNMARQAAEIWNSESQIPPLVFGGVIDPNDFGSRYLGRKEEPHIMITYQPGCYKEDGKKGCYKKSAYIGLTKFESKSAYSIKITLFGEVYQKYEVTESDLDKIFPGDEGLKKSIDVKKLEAYTLMPISWVITADQETAADEEVEVAVSINNATYSFSSTRYVADQNVTSVLIHEFGHALGMDHARSVTASDKCSDPTNGLSVMDSIATSRTAWHLWQHDKKCSRYSLKPRKTVYYQATPERWGRPFNIGQVTEIGETTKGTRLGINYKNSSGDEEVSLLSFVSTPFYILNKYVPDKISSSRGKRSVSCSRSRCLTKETEWEDKKSLFVEDDNPLSPNKHNMDVSPTYSKITWRSSVYDAFFYHITRVKENGKSVVYDPPLVAIHHKSPLTKEEKPKDPSNPYHTHSKQLLGKSSPDGDYEKISSHLPVSIAYDPHSKRYIYAVVNTNRSVCSHEKDGWFKEEGRIMIGIQHDTKESSIEKVDFHYLDQDQSGEENQHILEKNKIPKSVFWGASYKTQFGVAVACVDRFGSRQGYRYNCILAWIDRGLPWENNVLYTWFKVNAGGVDWSKRVYVREKFAAVGHLAAGFTKRSLIIAAKKDNQSAHYCVNPLETPYNFRTKYDLGKGHTIVDPPSIGTLPYPSEDKELKEFVDGYISWTGLKMLKTSKIE